MFVLSKILRKFIVGILLIFGIALLYKYYQNKNIEIVDIKDIQEVKIEPSGDTLQPETVITLEANLDSMKSICFHDLVPYEEKLYLITYKMPTIISSNRLDIPLANAVNNGTVDLGAVEMMIIVSGDIYQSENGQTGYSVGDLIHATGQRVIWEKTTE